MDVLKNIRDGKYENNVPYKYERIPINDDMTIRQAREHKEQQEELAKNQRRANQQEHAHLLELFQSDLEEEFGLKEHPKAHILWSKAWEKGHSYGWEEVYYEYSDLSELLT